MSNPEDYRGAYGQKRCPRRGCNQGRMPYVQNNQGRLRVVCPCGVSGPWKFDRGEAVNHWNDLPREPAFSSARPTYAGPWICKTAQGHAAIVDLTEQDVAGFTPTIACYVAFCPIPIPAGVTL